MEHAQVENSKLNARDERRRILGSPNYNRMGYKAEKKAVATTMGREFTSNLVVEMRAKNGSLQRGDITVLLAGKFGFCWGVERAVCPLYFALADCFSITSRSFTFRSQWRTKLERTIRTNLSI